MPVLAVLVCHDGEPWLRPALSALRRLSPRPRHVLAVDNGSTDRTPELLAEAATGPDAVLDGVLTRPADTGFGAAVAFAVDNAVARWGDPGQWIWLLHDDCAPEPDCLGVLLTSADVAPSAGVLGPLLLDWADPRLVVEVGLSTDASGHRQTGIGPTELDWARIGGPYPAASEPQAGRPQADGGTDFGSPASNPDFAPGDSGNRSFAQSSGIAPTGIDSGDGADGESAESGSGDIPARDFPPAGSDQSGFALDFAQRGFEQSTEALAVSSAGALVRRQVWHDLTGYDPALPLLRDDLDFGWRANRSGWVVLCVPAARMRHARALSRGLRSGEALAGRTYRSVDRAHGLRTLLVNSGTFGYLLGLPRLTVLCLLRAAGFVLLRRLADSRAELAALGYLLSGRAGLRAARARRRASGARPVHGLLTTRTTRLRNLLRGGMASWVRRRVAADAALGRLPDTEGGSAWVLPGTVRPVPRPVGPDALPAGALGRGRPARRTAGLRRPTTSVAVSLADPPLVGLKPSPRPRPSPVPRGGSAVPAGGRELVLVEVPRGRLVAQVLLAPPVLLLLGLVAFALLTNAGRLGGQLSGGGVLPAQDLGATWANYLASWHPVAGGTAAPAPAALAVLGALGTVLWPLGGPPAALAGLLLGDAPLAGLLAYAATRRLPVRRWVRALVAAGYAVLPPATAAVAQGRLDVVIVHILLPPVLVGVVAVVNPATRGGAAGSWLSSAACSALGLAVIGAFSPLVHALVVLFALAGFVLVPGRQGDGRRRVAALCAVVLLPLALLVPWPAVVLAHPVVLLSGVGGVLPTGPTSPLDLFTLNPGGPGAAPVVGGLVLLAVVVAVLLRPHRAMFPGLAVVLLGGAAAGVVAGLTGVPLAGLLPQRFWTGAPLLVVGCGLLWLLLTACRTDRPVPRRPQQRLLAGLGALAVLALVVGGVFAGRGGPLRAGNPLSLDEAITNELADTGRSVLIMATADQPARQAGGRLPAFGDDALAQVPGSAARLAGWSAQLSSGDPAATKTAIAQAATAGVLFVVLPDEATADRLIQAAGDLVSRVSNTMSGTSNTMSGTSDTKSQTSETGSGPSDTGSHTAGTGSGTSNTASGTSDTKSQTPNTKSGAWDTKSGRPVVRLQPASGAATLIAPVLAKQAVTGGAPPTTLGAQGISPVDAAPPQVAVRVSEGPMGRLLVLAAEDEAGWQATINGQPAPIVRAWGHLVAVSVPMQAADVVVEQPTALRDVLLLVEAAVLLFTVLTAIPSRRQPSPSTTSGSRPR